MLSDISKIRSTHTYTPEVQAPFFISWVPNHLIFLAGTHLFSMAVPTTSWVDIHIYTLSPILIEVKNGCVWKVTILLDEPTFNFHAYGRKCNNTWQKVQVHWTPPSCGIPILGEKSQELLTGGHIKFLRDTSPRRWPFECCQQPRGSPPVGVAGGSKFIMTTKKTVVNI